MLLTEEPQQMMESMRIATMDLADRQPLRPDEPNAEFGREDTSKNPWR
jgi:hypothetical protein